MIKIPDVKNRNLIFSKQVDQASIGDLTEKIIEINQSDALIKKHYKAEGLKYKPKPIKLYIDSYGGYVYQIQGLIGVIQSSKTPIHTIVTGAAMSCGFLLLIAGHKRFALPHASLMYHQVSSGSSGKLQDMKEDLQETNRLQKWIDDLVLSGTSISKEVLKKNNKNKKDWFITSKEALKLKIIDQILTTI